MSGTRKHAADTPATVPNEHEPGTFIGGFGFVDMATPPSKDHASKRSDCLVDNTDAAKLDRLDSSVDYVESQLVAPELRVTLVPKSLYFYVGTTAMFLCVFTTIAYNGVVMQEVYDAIGSSKVAEGIVETYNTTSGFIMALVEVLVGLHMAKFLPVFEVHLHNALWFLNRSTSHAKVAARAHTTLLFLFPVVLMLLIGNSLRGFQAGHSTVGFDSIMVADDLKKEQPTLELLRAANSGNSSAANATTINGQRMRALNDIILKNAIREHVTPFSFATKSPCVQTNGSAFGRGQRIVPISAHDLDATSVVYGFVPREWNGEAISEELTPTTTFTIKHNDAIRSPSSIKLPPANVFSMATAFEMLFQGATMVEKAISDSVNQNHTCSESDYMTDLDGFDAPTRRLVAANATSAANATRSINSTGSADLDDMGYDDSYGQWMLDANGTRICDGPVSSLIDLLEYDTPSTWTVDNLMHGIANSFNKSLPDLFDLNATELLLETYAISPQVQVQSMRITAMFANDIEYGLTPETVDCFFSDKGCPHNTKVNGSAYLFSDLSNAFCGSANCAFLDLSDTFALQREVALIPYMTNCSGVAYSGDFHGFYPAECTKQQNAAFVYGIGSFIGGDEYGSNDTVYGTHLPYILHPRRHVTFTFVKLMWHVENAATSFDAHCDKTSVGGNCQGLWYKLEPSGRYLFAGEDALPTASILHANFHAPISLVQLNAPGIHIDDWDVTVSLERLDASHFGRTHWDASKGESLKGDACSMLIDSYLHHMEANNYFLERPMQTVYTAAFYYLMASAGVTELLDATAIVNGTTTAAATKASTRKNDPLGNMKLKGDLQRRSIKVQIPVNSFVASFVGLMVLVLLAALVLLWPTRRVEYFADDTSKAQEYIAVATEAAYPSLVYVKTLAFPASGEHVPLKDYKVEAMALVHEASRGHSIQLP